MELGVVDDGKVVVGFERDETVQGAVQAHEPVLVVLRGGPEIRRVVAHTQQIGQGGDEWPHNVHLGVERAAVVGRREITELIGEKRLNSALLVNAHVR